MRDGSVRLVVATNALELGIDIGGLGAAILVGYAGSISSTWQQSGRAGRGDDPAAAVLVASPNPLDQFLAHHPEYFFGRSPEHALVNPNHLLILLEHLRCALFELPFKDGEGFGELPPETVHEYLEVLVANNEAHASAEKVFWMADAYPAANISLRSASPANVILHTEDDSGPRTVGEVDLASAVWMVHPRAVYLHEGQQYFVQDLDLTRNIATLIPVGLDYYTEPLRETTIQIISIADQTSVAHPPSSVTKSWGELQVTTQVTGFRKRSWLGGEPLGEEPLDLPPSDLQTTGYWLSLSETTITLVPVGPQRVVLPALLGVGQDGVGLVDVLESPLGRRVAGVAVRMVLARQLPERLLDVDLTGRAGDPEDLVVVAVLHRRSPNPGAAGPLPDRRPRGSGLPLSRPGRRPGTGPRAGTRFVARPGASRFPAPRRRGRGSGAPAPAAWAAGGGRPPGPGPSCRPGPA